MSGALLVLLLMPLIASSASAQDPFKPAKVLPFCSVSVTRGAQQAYDDFRRPLWVAYEESKYNYPPGQDASMRLGLAIERYKIRNKLINKESELKDFAKKKYKCELYLRDFDFLF